MDRVLLHTCCAPCSAAVIERLLAEGSVPVVFFFNPNIYPQAEYLKRKAELVEHCRRMKVEMIDGDYDHDRWLLACGQLAAEPERGARCLECFRLRLLETARLAARLGISQFATTLASSRWKRIDQIAEAGRWAAAQVEGVSFMDRNWRKDGLQQRRQELLRQYGFYNQQYCGCEFSIRPQP